MSFDNQAASRLPTESPVCGYGAGAAITSGTQNVLIGDRAGRLITTGSKNVAIGAQTLFSASATDSTENTCVGFGCGFAITSAIGNSHFGNLAGTAVTTGANNTMVGDSAGKQTNSGGSNVFLGRAAANANTTGGFNTAVGHATGYQFTSGNGNTWIGNQAGDAQGPSTPTTGDYNIAIGNFSGCTATGKSRTIAIGAGSSISDTALVSNSNTGKIGIALTDFTISGNLFWSTSDSALNNASGQTLTTAQLLSGTLDRSGAAGVSDTTPTAAAIVAAIPGCEVGSSCYLCIINRNTGTLTLLAGSGVTLAGTTTIATVFSRWYLIRVTNVGTPAVTMRGLMTAAN